jgi:glycosyltransferase involved in cell wall biosynthesis
MLHNYYQQRGGEDGAVEQDVALLRERGHAVHFHTIHNDEIARYGVLQKASLWFRPTWSRKSYKEVRAVIEAFRPDVMHVHNFFPLLSPSAYCAARDCGVPVVQTLHNYRILVPCALLMRDELVCELCIKQSLWNGIRYRCYHGSVIQTASIAVMIATHRWLGTWNSMVDRYIALTEFSKGVFVRGGLPESKILVRPNFLMDDPGVGTEERSGAVFVGRLSPEKGVVSLLEAWRRLPEIPLSVIGDGPLGDWVARFVREHSMGHVRLMGAIPFTEMLNVLGMSQFLVFPSVCYETFGRTIIEAYSTGTPVLVSDIGSGGSLVEQNATGLHFGPGNLDDLAAKAREMVQDAGRLRRWARNARQRYIQEHSADKAFESLMEIYTNL